jgi:hypothetical protein
MHSDSPNKDFDAFWRGIAKQIQASNYDFRGYVFVGTANFSGQVFAGQTDFREATFSARAVFNEAKFLGRADFTETVFSDASEFVETRFFGGASFAEAVFSGPVDFTSAVFGAAELAIASVLRQRPEVVDALALPPGTYDQNAHSFVVLKHGHQPTDEVVDSLLEAVLAVLNDTTSACKLSFVDQISNIPTEILDIINSLDNTNHV